MTLFSIIIPTYNRPDFLEKNLGEIQRQIGATDTAEIIVVDDGSGNAHSRAYDRICSGPGVSLVHHPRNRGMAVARNTGARKAKGTWLIFLDDDVYPGKGWFGELRKKTDGAQKALGIEGKIVPSGDGLWDQEVQNLTGGLFLTSHIVFRREVFFAAGGFDEEFEHRGPFAEDHEFAARIRTMGPVIFAPDLWVTHMPRDIRPFRLLSGAPRRILGFLRSEQYFCSTHPKDYARYRHAQSFWGTYRNVALRHTFSALHRRGMQALLWHPAQALLLATASLIEQFMSWLVLPVLIADNIRQHQSNRKRRR